MSDDSSPVFRRRPLRPQPIPPAGPAAAVESAVAPRVSEDDAPLLRRRPFCIRTNPPQSPESPSQGQSKLAVPPTPGSVALVPADASQASGVLSQNRSDPGSSSLQSDVGPRWKEARQLARALRLQEREERRQKREARKRESLSNRQHFLKNKFMAHQAREANDKDESVEGSSNSDDDGYFLLSFFSSFFWTSPFYFLIAQPTVIVPTSPTSRMARIIQMLP